jgi:hypothetical protein
MLNKSKLVLATIAALIYLCQLFPPLKLWSYSSTAFPFALARIGDLQAAPQEGLLTGVCEETMQVKD